MFPNVFEEGGKKGKELTMIQAIEQRATKKQASNSSESKTAAYKLLNSLARRSPELMKYFFTECMRPLLDFIERTDTWNYTPPSASERG